MSRTAILNGFGRTLGDSIIGMQALAIARERARFRERPVLFRLPGLSPVIQDVYRAGSDLAEIRDLPWEEAAPHRPFAPAAGFSHVIDMRDFAFDPAFAKVAMIDYFLQQLGVDPQSVPSEQKRNRWLALRVRPTSLRKDMPILLCPKTANPLRDMPPKIHDYIKGWLARKSHGPVISQADVPPAGTLQDLCGLVASAGLMISADTAMVHLADTFHIPCLVFFTTHRPQWRVRDYPDCMPVDLEAELPPSLEFARDAHDVEAAQASWSAHGEGWLEERLTAALSRRRFS